MDRRHIVGAVAAPIFGGGVASLIAALNPAYASVARSLFAIGGAAIGAALATWVVLLITAGRREASPDRGFMRLEEVGRRLYKENAGVRAHVPSFIGDVYNDANDAATAYAHEGAIKSGVTLYARRGPGLPLEPVEPEETKRNAYDAMFNKDATDLKDVSIRRRDIRRILRHYRPGASA